MLTITSVALFFLLSSASALDPVDLGTAGDFAILTKSGITTTGVTSVTGDIGSSTNAATGITGFSLSLHSSTAYSTSIYVTGNVYAASYTSPTPSNLGTAILDMQAAFVDAAGRPTPDFTELHVGKIGGETLVPGLYKWSKPVDIATNSHVTFDGNATDVWILQIAQDLIVGNGASVFLTGGALPENIFWQISGSTQLESTAHVEGIFLCKTAIVFKYGSSMNGRALAQTAVTLDAVTIVEPSVTIVEPQPPARRLRGLGF